MTPNEPDKPEASYVLAEAAETDARPRQRPPRARDSRGAVLFLLFVVLGPLALGELWKSPRFGTAWKTILTVLTVGQFALVIWILWYAVNRFLAAL